MRILFTCRPVVGHFYPLVPVARALAGAGHDVAFATHPSLQPAIESAGFRHVAAGFGPSSREVADLMAQARDLSGEVLLEHIWGRLFAGLLARRMAGDLLALPEARAADLIVRDTTELGGCIAAERLGLPHAAVSALAAGITPGAPEWIAEPLDALRDEYGLPPDPDGIMPFRYLTLQPSVRSLLPLPPRLTDHLVRPVPFDGSTDEDLPSWLDVLPDRLTVYATLGTVFNRRADIFETILAGLRDEPINLIVTIGHDQDPARFGSQPPHIRIERYIPQTRLLSRCDLVLSHGGSGTLLAALVVGVPLVTVPLGADQPENARACQALGAGRTLDPTTLTPELVRDAVRSVLSDGAYRRNAEQLRDALAELPGPERAATLLETLAVERRPLVDGPELLLPHRPGTPNPADVRRS